MKKDPYILAVASHKGGTGRTTSVLALSWCWGQMGLSVTLVDADPVRASSLVALDQSGRCHWPNVRVSRTLPNLRSPQTSDIIIVDCPSLLDPLAMPILEQSHGVIVTCLADPLSLRTVPAAASAISTARVNNPQLELLGILIGIYDNHDAVQTAMLARLRQLHGELLLEPPIPVQPELRDWPLSPGTGVPAGIALDAYQSIARTLESWIRLGLGV